MPKRLLRGQARQQPRPEQLGDRGPLLGRRQPLAAPGGSARGWMVLEGLSGGEWWENGRKLVENWEHYGNMVEK